MASRHGEAYRRIRQLLTDDLPVILDGGVATELERVAPRDIRVSDQTLWGIGALAHAPYAVLEVHRRYAAAGCDLISTNTWALLRAPEMEARVPAGRSGLTHWMDAARLGVRLARQAVDEAGRTGLCAVAFSVNADVDRPEKQDTLQLLTRVFEEDPPDLVLMETLSLIRDPYTFAALELMLKTGLPVWLSFRRCRHGVCGVHGQHWGGPEGDRFGRAAREFERMGAGALMINCLPVDHVPGMLPWLRDFTDMPLGVYPNLGRFVDPGWKTDERVGPEDYGRLARQWREEGAQIVGGCCGVGPEHVAAARTALAGTRPGRRRAAAPAASIPPPAEPARPAPFPEPWVDEQGRSLFPVPLPQVVCDPGVFQPTQGSFLVWKHLFKAGVGKGKRCLDVGCGTGILAIQLALNGAREVDAIDIQPEAVANTMTNAFRNSVAERVRGKVTDLYTFVPEQRYDVVVASVYQMPVDPEGEITGHRPADYWGRNLLDHLLSNLPLFLSDGGVAYVLQISLLGQRRTAELLAERGMACRVIDFSFFPFTAVFRENLEQIRRVEKTSDAYHFALGGDEVMVMYLLEAARGGGSP
jgi:S-methylmethionine-dependent homocysteine/selenocysteine methylase/SAM-dependent methyltransferase